jgi:hypothetical protein
MAEQKKKKKKNKADKENAIKVILMTDEETNKEEEDIGDEDEDAGGMYLEKEDVQLIYNALKNYKPANDDEEMVYEMLVESFEEMLVVDFKVKLPGFEFMDEEDE